MSELVNFEPAKNGKISVVVGGISFLCDTEEDGRRRAATMLLREVVRLRSEQNNPVEQLANVRRELELFEAVERVQPEPAKPAELTHFRGSYLCRNCGVQSGFHGEFGECPKTDAELEANVQRAKLSRGDGVSPQTVPSTSVEPQPYNLDCQPNPLSSRVCERGTGGCNVKHPSVEPQPTKCGHCNGPIVDGVKHVCADHCRGCAELRDDAERKEAGHLRAAAAIARMKNPADELEGVEPQVEPSKDFNLYHCPACKAPIRIVFPSEFMAAADSVSRPPLEQVIKYLCHTNSCGRGGSIADSLAGDRWENSESKWRNCTCGLAAFVRERKP